MYVWKGRGGGKGRDGKGHVEGYNVGVMSWRLPKAFCLIKRRSLCQRDVSKALYTLPCYCLLSPLALLYPHHHPFLANTRLALGHAKSFSQSASEAIAEIDYVCFNLANVINMFMGFGRPPPPFRPSPRHWHTPRGFYFLDSLLTDFI